MTMSAETWTIQRLLQWSIGYLTGKSLADSPRLDAELLLAHTLGVSRVYLYTHYDRILSPAEREPFRHALLRRGQGEPIAYILGFKEFLGQNFEVTPAVLIPRPDTEIVVETAIQAARYWSVSADAHLQILDIGTGSGCIAIAMAMALPHAQVTAWDVSRDALTVARRNAAQLGVQSRIQFIECDALDPAAWQTGHTTRAGGEAFHLIVSNPPYIAHAEKGDLSHTVAAFEPHSALFAAEEGLIFYRQIAAHAAKIMRPDGKLVLEIGYGQAQSVSAILAEKGWLGTSVIRDLGRNDRCILASHPFGKGGTFSETEECLPENEDKSESLEHKMRSEEPNGKAPFSEVKARSGASATGEPIYIAFEEEKRALRGATRYDQPSAPNIEHAAHISPEQTASTIERTYVPLDDFGRPRRSGASYAAPIEYVTHAISGEEEELLTKYATENASDVETDT